MPDEFGKWFSAYHGSIDATAMELAWNAGRRAAEAERDQLLDFLALLGAQIEVAASKQSGASVREVGHWRDRIRAALTEGGNDDAG